MRRSSATVALAALLSLLTTASLTSAEAAPSGAATASLVGDRAVARHASRLTASLPTGTRRARSRVVVTGRVSGAAGRPVQIQARGANGTWVTLSQGRTADNGTFSVRAPTWWVASQRLRAYAPATGDDSAAASSRTGTMRVRRSYAPRSGTGFTYLFGHQARWNPCQPITYRVNRAHLPANGLAQLRAGFAAVSEATGLRFTYVGATTFVPYKRGQSSTEHVKHADLAVAWSTPSVVPYLAGATMGVGGAQGDSVDHGPMELHNGAVVFDASQRLRGPRAWVRRQRKSLVLHELGHAVGLNHVTDRRQIMSAVLPSTAPRYARGDLRGLAAVGAKGGCFAHSVR